MVYTVVLLREDDGRYSVLVPALKGCHTCGDTLPEALRMADEVIRLFVASLRERGLPVPADQSDVTVNMEDASEALVYKLRVIEQEATLVA